jgi:spermidine synthase
MVATTFASDTPNLVTNFVRTQGVAGNWQWWAFTLTGVGTVFGNTVFAVSTVLTAFMLGLALGSWLFGGIADKSRNPLRLYAVVELLVGAYALAFPGVLKRTDLFYLWLYRTFEPGFTALSLVRFVISVITLIG